jgi:hypothetical protein
MKSISIVFSALLILSTVEVLAKGKPASAGSKAVEKSPVVATCIQPFKEAHSTLRSERKSQFDLIKLSYRNGEISEAELEQQLEAAAGQFSNQIAALEAQKEICLAQFED